MEFRLLDVKDVPRIRELLREAPLENSYYSVTYHVPYANSPITKASFAESNGCGIFRWIEGDGYRHFFPFGGGDKVAALKELQEHCRRNSIRMMVSSMDAGNVEMLKATLGEKWDITECRREFDYVYRVDAMAALAGKKYQRMRTTINKFVKGCVWSFDPIVDDNGLVKCQQIIDQWRAAKLASGKELMMSMIEETDALEGMLPEFWKFGIFGWILHRDGEPVAFTIGEELSPKMVLHAYAKSKLNAQGAMQVGDWQFSRCCLGKYEMQNYSCDEDSPGLREFKLNYHPERFVVQYVAIERA